jgi:hypothetical protein
MTVEKETMLKWIKEYWFLGAFLVASGMAWAETTTKVQSLEQAVKSQVQVQQEIVHLREGQATLDERTKLMLEEQKETRQLLKQILIEQHKVIH